MGSMDAYSRWPIPGTYWGEYPYGGFGGFYPGSTQQQMNLWGQQPYLGGYPFHPRWAGPSGEGMRQIEMWKCDHCGSRFEEKPEHCKNCGSNAILRFDQPGRGAAQRQQPFDMETAFLFGALGMPPKQQSVSEAVAEFREEVAAITTGGHIKLSHEQIECLYPKCWVSRCWSRFLLWLDRCGYRGR